MEKTLEHNSYTTFSTFLKNAAFFAFGIIIIGSSVMAGVMIYANNHGGSQSLLPFQKLVSPQQVQNSENMKHITANPTPQTIAETGQPKTYTNTTLKLSFVIPAEYQAKEAAYGLGTTSIELRRLDNLTEATSPDIQILIFPKAMGNIIGQDFDEYRAMEDNTVKQINDSQGTQMFTKIANREIGTLRAFDYQTISATPSTNEEAEAGTYIEAGANILIFSTRESNKGSLEPILSSIIYPIKAE